MGAVVAGSSVQIGSDSWSGWTVKRRVFGVLAIASLGAAWTSYVFAGSQIAYCVAVAVGCGIAAYLAWRRDPLVLIFLIGVLALLGPEARGSLGRGRALLGDGRIFDLVLLTAFAAALAASFWGRRGTVRQLRSGLRRCSLALGHRYSLAIAAGLVVWAIALWIRQGHPFDPYTRTDLRLILLGAAAVGLVATVRPVRPESLATGLVAVASLAAAKAYTISLSGLWVVGPNDRLQASLRGDEGRVILSGGDTLLAMAPALAVVALGREPSPKRVVALTLAAVSTVGGLLISGTRTSFLVAVILLTLAGAWRFAPAVATSRLAIGCSIVVVGMAGLGYAGGVLNPALPTQDAAHVGVNFRLDEAKALLGMKADEVLVGQGIGGRFESKDVNGQPVTTGWAH